MKFSENQKWAKKLGVKTSSLFPSVEEVCDVFFKSYPLKVKNDFNKVKQAPSSIQLEEIKKIIRDQEEKFQVLKEKTYSDVTQSYIEFFQNTDYLQSLLDTIQNDPSDQSSYLNNLLVLIQTPEAFEVAIPYLDNTSGPNCQGKMLNIWSDYFLNPNPDLLKGIFEKAAIHNYQIPPMEDFCYWGAIVLREEKSLEDNLSEAEHFCRENKPAENSYFLNDFYFYDKRFDEVFTTEEKISLYLDITKEKWFKREIFFKALLDSVENLDHQDKNGWTSLHRLAFEGHVLGVERLLDAGADPELKTKEGLTPLQLFSLGTNIQGEYHLVVSRENVDLEHLSAIFEQAILKKKYAPCL